MHYRRSAKKIAFWSASKRTVCPIMNTQIFIEHLGQRLGPFDLSSVNAKLQNGELDANDLAWSAGQSDWQPLRTLSGVIVPAAGLVPPPLPAQPPTNASPHPASTTGDAGWGSEAEVTIFDTSASPLALSMGDLVWGLLCTGGLWWGYAVVRNLTTRYKLTNQRLTLRSGLISQKVEQIEAFRIRDVTMEQEAIGRLLGFGDVVVHSSDASAPKVVLRHIHSPDKIKEQIRTASRQARRSEGVHTWSE